MKNRIPTTLIAIFFSFAFLTSLHAEVPNTITYQGYLTDSSGTPVTATESMTFSIYDASTGGNVLWSEFESVPVSNGTFNNQLGDTTAFPVNLFNGQALFIGVKVGADPEMFPRKPVTSAPYAFKAATADVATLADSAIQADNATTLDGQTAAELDQSAHVIDTNNPHSVTAAQVGAATPADLAAHTAIADAHHAPYTDAEAVSAMGVLADGNNLNHVKYADSDAVAAILSADGAGSTFDADLLDGQQASEIIEAASDEVRTPISQSDMPFTINESGSYYFTGNIVHADSATHAVTISADNVTLDLMGFTLTGSGKNSGNRSGIYAANRSYVSIKNGKIKSFGLSGISIGSILNVGGGSISINRIMSSDNGGSGIALFVTSSRIENCFVQSNGDSGINTSGSSTIKNNVSTDNGTDSSFPEVIGIAGIYVDGRSYLTGNVVNNNFSIGIGTRENSLLVNNSVYLNAGTGIRASAGIILNNQVLNNAGTGIRTGPSVLDGNSVVENNTGNSTNNGGIVVFSDSRVTNNQVSNNSSNAIVVNGSDTLIESNYINDSTVGIDFNETGNAWRNNTFSGVSASVNGSTGNTNGGDNLIF